MQLKCQQLMKTIVFFFVDSFLQFTFSAMTNYPVGTIPLVKINAPIINYSLFTTNATFQISYPTSYQFISFQVNIIGYPSVAQTTNPLLSANFEMPSYYNSDQELQATFFNAINYYQGKYSMFVIFNQSDFTISPTSLYVTLLVQDLPGYQIAVSASGQDSQMACPSDCNSLQASCLHGICQCQDGYIDEDCSQEATRVEFNVVDTTSIILKDSVEYVYSNINELYPQSTTLSAELTASVQKETTVCILFHQQECKQAYFRQCTILPLQNEDNNSNLCLTVSILKQTIVISQDFSNLQIGKKLIIGLVQQNSVAPINLSMKLLISKPNSNNQDNSQVIIIALAVGIPLFGIVFVLLGIYCWRKRRRNSTWEQTKGKYLDNQTSVDYDNSDGTTNTNRENTFNNNNTNQITLQQTQNPLKKSELSDDKLDSEILEKYLPFVRMKCAREYLASQKREIDNDYECPFCQVQIQNSDKVRVSMCLHVLHMECFDKCFIAASRCPLCRRSHSISKLKKFANNAQRQSNRLKMIKSQLNESKSFSEEQNLDKDFPDTLGSMYFSNQLANRSIYLLNKNVISTQFKDTCSSINKNSFIKQPETGKQKQSNNKRYQENILNTSSTQYPNEIDLNRENQISEIQLVGIKNSLKIPLTKSPSGLKKSPSQMESTCSQFSPMNSYNLSPFNSNIRKWRKSQFKVQELENIGSSSGLPSGQEQFSVFPNNTNNNSNQQSTTKSSRNSKNFNLNELQIGETFGESQILGISPTKPAQQAQLQVPSNSSQLKLINLIPQDQL